MKKSISKILVAVFVCAALCCAFAGCGNREQILKIYNWGEYMDPEVYEGFEDWYYEQTGKTIKVKYKEFDTNESMYTEISVNKADYDLVCPSDYMVERMRNAGLLKPLNKEIFTADKELYYDGLWDMVNDSVDPGLTYSMPYVWGTFGIMYDSEKVEEEDVADFDSWEAMFSEKYKKKILMKNSVRDAYSIARIYDNTAVLSQKSSGFTDYNADYKQALDSIFKLPDSDEQMRANIAAAYDRLVKQKSVLLRYEVDDGKDDMINPDSEPKLGFFWSCDAGYAMEESNTLFYVVPKEGANVWVDCFVIPKYARNEEAANYFLQYLCTATVDDSDEDFGGALVAEKNMDWLGTSIAVKEAMLSVKEQLEADDGSDEDSMFFEAPEGFKEMYLEMVFPPDEVLARCAIMRDFGKFNFELDGMWIDVKTA